ncbi:hypothetical protein GNI_233860 [Gregarina niphandrodes]|uniref:Uncharacterized protein n=1 Tax=Gregarina niphandrodes TaxID=110365 RepID=A0A023AVB8_GRENI|nr:hypothetical protein GNI_233860 [Gregarina niphandrodes]EZG42729.1 hypothetical protein GNI_233860 [Gregarina niphandrodes]|eukprot:XP_011133992.1 hypothetical protein GNI_233860 [Gregarina niphandrodes]
MMEGRITLRQTEGMLSDLPDAFWQLFRRIKTIIVLEDDVHGCLERMRNRNNGIDSMTIDYVIAQNQVFQLLAKFINAKVIVHKKGENMDCWMRRLHQETMSLWCEGVLEGEDDL